MTTAAGTAWRVKGRVSVACNCDYGCPCNFNARPTQGNCEGGWIWHVDEGSYGDVRLDGLNFAIFADWPGAIHEGNGEAAVFVDERADERQREAITTMLGGTVGGPWAILRRTWTNVHEARYVPFELDLRDRHTKARAGDLMELEMEPIRNPVTGVEAHPSVQLPEGFIFKEGHFASSKTYRVNDGVRYDHSGHYTAYGPFEYSGP